MVLSSRIKKIVPVEKIKKVRFREARADPQIQIGFVIFVIHVFDLNNMSASVFLHKEFEVLVFIKKNHFFEIKIFFKFFKTIFNLDAHNFHEENAV